MGDMLQSGLSWLGSMLKQHASRQVEYRRGAQSVLLSAVVGRTSLEISDDLGGVRTEYTDRDYLIVAADLVLGGVAVEPQRDDVIADGTTGVTQLYEVRMPGNAPPWRWSDPYRQVLRIHTKLIGEE